MFLILKLFPYLAEYKEFLQYQGTKHTTTLTASATQTSNSIACQTQSSSLGPWSQTPTHLTISLVSHIFSQPSTSLLSLFLILLMPMVQIQLPKALVRLTSSLPTFRFCSLYPGCPNNHIFIRKLRKTPSCSFTFVIILQLYRISVQVGQLALDMNRMSSIISKHLHPKLFVLLLTLLISFIIIWVIQVLPNFKRWCQVFLG